MNKSDLLCPDFITGKDYRLTEKDLQAYERDWGMRACIPEHCPLCDDLKDVVQRLIFELRERMSRAA